MIHAIQLLISHGLSGYLIVATGVVCIVISIERLFFLFAHMSYDAEQALKQIKTQIVGRNYSQALQVSSGGSQSPELVVVKEGLMALENGREALQSALTVAVLNVGRACEKRLSYLSLVASSATLIGLFGTIMGLIKTFEAIAGADPAEKGRLLGLGISEAMHSTAAGVIVGVVAMAVHTVCVAKSDAIVGKAQDVALNMVKWIEQSERKGV